MREDDGRRLDHKTLEQLRIRAVRQIEQGAHPEDVAAALGMTRAAVYGWLAKYREGGLAALRAHAEITRLLFALWRPRWCSSTHHASHAG